MTELTSDFFFKILRIFGCNKRAQTVNTIFFYVSTVHRFWTSRTDKNAVLIKRYIKVPII